MIENHIYDGGRARYKFIHKNAGLILNEKEKPLAIEKYKESGNADKAFDFVLNKSLEFILANYSVKSFDIIFYELAPEKALELFHSSIKEVYGMDLIYLEVDSIPENERRYFSIIRDDNGNEERFALKAVVEPNLLSVYGASKIGKPYLEQAMRDLRHLAEEKILAVDERLRSVKASKVTTGVSVPKINEVIKEAIGESVGGLEKKLKKIDKRTKKIDEATKAIILKTYNDEVLLESYLSKGVMKGEAYIVSKGKIFNGAIIIQAINNEFKIKELKSTIEYVNMTINGEEEPIRNYVVRPGEKATINIEFKSPAEPMKLVLSLYGEIKIQGNEYLVESRTEPETIKSGNVKAQKALKITKKVLKFAVPKIAKRIKAAMD
ncbi:MAG: hypothetical protein ACTSPW_00045 [Promethearchaeota archaeon]